MPQLVRVTLFLFFATAVCLAGKVPSQTMTWSLRDEFRSGAVGENPNFDREGQLVWHFLGTSRSQGPVESRKWLRDAVVSNSGRLDLLQRRHYNPTCLAVLDKPTVTRGVCQRDPEVTRAKVVEELLPC